MQLIVKGAAKVMVYGVHVAIIYGSVYLVGPTHGLIGGAIVASLVWDFITQLAGSFND